MRFCFAPPPLSDFGERLLELFGAVLCTKTCRLLVQKSSFLRCLTVGFRRNPTSKNAENRIASVRARLVCSTVSHPMLVQTRQARPPKAGALPGTTVLERALPSQPRAFISISGGNNLRYSLELSPALYPMRRTE